MILRDLVDKGDYDKITRNFMHSLDRSEDEYEKVYEKLKNFGQKLSNWPYNESDEIMIAENYHTVYAKDNTVTSSLYKKDEFMDFLKNLKEGMVFPDKEELINKTDGELEEICLSLNKELGKPDSYAYEFSLWEEILGAGVLIENINRTGLDGFCFDVLYELSFNGFERETQEERRKELEERIKEAEERNKKIFELAKKGEDLADYGFFTKKEEDEDDEESRRISEEIDKENRENMILQILDMKDNYAEYLKIKKDLKLF